VRCFCPRLLLVFCLFARHPLFGQAIPDSGNKLAAQSLTNVKVPASAVAVTNSEIGASHDLKVLLPANDLLQQATLLYRAGKLGPALQKYKLIRESSPGSPQGYAGMARIYLKQGNVEGAAQVINEGLALSNSDDLHIALGEIYFRRGQILDAEREWSAVVNAGSRSARAYLGMARVSNALALYEEGKAMIGKARKLDSIDPDIEVEWNATLPVAERIRRLNNYLESPEGARADDRGNSQHYLDYLKMLANAAGNCQLVQPRDSAELPMIRILADAEHVRGFGLKMSINGRKAELMLDTGVSGILLSRRLAEKARLMKMAETRIGGIGDGEANSGYVAIASSVNVGELEFRDCPVRVLSEGSVVDEEGVIGADFFQQFLVNLDFPELKLRLGALPKRSEGDADGSAGLQMKLEHRYRSPEMSLYTQAYRFGAYLLVPTRVGDGRDRLFVLDTGGSASQITPSAAREVTQLRGDSGTTISGINGKVRDVFSADHVSLQLGRLPGQSRNLMSFDLTPVSNSVGTEVSGTLGFDVLRSLNIKIDYRDALVDFQDSKRWNR
jgi:tetratricopeptide (TPR) repeat protein